MLRTQELYKEKGIILNNTFTEFLKGYFKLIIINSRENIIRLMEVENYYLSLQRLIAQKQKQLLEPENFGTEKTLNTKLKKESESQENKKTKEKNIQGLFTDDDRLVNESSKRIDIKDYEGRNIIYEPIFQLFEKRADNLIKLGAHYIDRNSLHNHKSNEIII